MTEFTGFPQGTRFTPVPDLFMTALALDIDETFELKVSLYIFWLLNRKKGYPRFVTLTELLAEQTLAQKLTAGETPGEEILRDALNRSVARGTFLRLSVEKDGNRQDLYFANTEAGRKAVEEIKRGRLELGRPLYEWKRGATGERTPDIFTLYQDNIGLLTPIISDELLEAEKTYPASWIEDAFKEAVDLNKRNWRYISRILERWSAEGKGNGKSGRHFKKNTFYGKRKG